MTLVKMEKKSNTLGRGHHGDLPIWSPWPKAKCVAPAYCKPTASEVICLPFSKFRGLFVCDGMEQEKTIDRDPVLYEFPPGVHNLPSRLDRDYKSRSNFLHFDPCFSKLARPHLGSLAARLRDVTPSLKKDAACSKRASWMAMIFFMMSDACICSLFTMFSIYFFTIYI